MEVNINEIYFIGQLILALILGGLLGWQRQKWRRSAGLRTYALVTAGSTLFTILSVYAFNDSDPARVAAQIVTGIGFLGAGTILHKKDHVEGLTTAAGLWMSAAIGMAIGVHYYLLSITTTLLILIILALDDKKSAKEKK